MSRAFVKEDAEVVERLTRRRAASGLPPGAINYMTTDGAERLRARLVELRGISSKEHDEEIGHLEDTLASATIIEPQPKRDTVTFGARVTVSDAEGKLETYRIVGVDEVDFDSANVSWVSPIARSLLGAVVSQRVSLDGGTLPAWTVVKIE